jgi:ribosome-associated translation inhibitor RaiA
MRLHIEGKDMTIVPHLMGRIAERLEQLNDVYDDIMEARFTLVSHNSQYEARVRLLLAGKTLYATQHGNSPDAAIGVALRCVEDALYAQRALRRRSTPVIPPPQKAPSPHSSPFTGHRPTEPPERMPLYSTTAKKIVW